MNDDPEVLQEKNFIQNGYKKNPYPFWVWTAIVAALFALLLGGKTWYWDQMRTQISNNPFLQVTNRQISLFLWQNPHYMRANAQTKSGYLSDFQYLNRVSVEPDLADRYVIAPPELLFQYHVWKQWLSDQTPMRPISQSEFLEFLDYSEEWNPKYWNSAPLAYIELVKSITNGRISESNLAVLSKARLPQDVRLAFQGWKNYFKEGDLINQVKPSYEQMKTFLDEYPNYARNYWRNIVPNYLASYEKPASDSAIIPQQELSPFLRAAFFNFQKKNASL